MRDITKNITLITFHLCFYFFSQAQVVPVVYNGLATNIGDTEVTIPARIFNWKSYSQASSELYFSYSANYTIASVKDANDCETATNKGQAVITVNSASKVSNLVMANYSGNNSYYKLQIEPTFSSTKIAEVCSGQLGPMGMASDLSTQIVYEMVAYGENIENVRLYRNNFILQEELANYPGLVFYTLAHNETDGKLYGIGMSVNTRDATQTLYEIDKTTGALTAIGNLGITGYANDARSPDDNYSTVTGLTYDPVDNVLIAGTINNQLYKIDPNTGSETFWNTIASINDLRTLEWDVDQSKLYGGNGGLWEIDRITGVPTSQIGSISFGLGMVYAPWATGNGSPLTCDSVEIPQVANIVVADLFGNNNYTKVQTSPNFSSTKIAEVCTNGLAPMGMASDISTQIVYEMAAFGENIEDVRLYRNDFIHQEELAKYPGLAFYTLAHDEQTGKLYSVGMPVATPNVIQTLYEIDKISGELTAMGNLGITGYANAFNTSNTDYSTVIGLTYDPVDNVLLASTTDNQLFEINPNTGKETLWTDIGRNLPALEWDLDQSKLYGINEWSGEFWEINRITGELTILGNTDGNLGMVYAPWAIGDGSPLTCGSITLLPTPTCTEKDSLALIALYNSTDGANWTNKWDLNQPMHTWYGVALTQDRCVKDLILSENNLIGCLPAELGQLGNLRSLYLNNNQLSGAIPAELGNLINVRELALSNNQLKGCIPDNFQLFCNFSQRNYNDFNLLPDSSYNLTNNPSLPWGGSIEPWCNEKSQIDAPCDDGNDVTYNDKIREDCDCRGCTTQILAVTGSICSGENYRFGDKLLNQEGIYSDTTTSTYGCDSITFLDLKILEPSEFFVLDTLCDGENMTINNIVYNQENRTGIQILTNASGCDSVISVNLTFSTDLKVADAGLDTTICTRNYELKGNLPNYATGKWSMSNSSVDLERFDAQNTSAYNLLAGENIFTWTLSHSKCPDYSTDDITINVLGSLTPIAKDKFFPIAPNEILKDTLTSTNDNWIITNLANPSHGILDVEEGNLFTYEPDIGFNGEDFFGYTICNNICLDSCAAAIVRVGVGEINNDDIIEYFDLFPNPNVGDFTINIKALRNANLEIQIFNILGELVYTKQNNQSGAGLTILRGDNSILIELPFQNEGVYFLSFVVNEEQVRTAKTFQSGVLNGLDLKQSQYIKFILR